MKALYVYESLDFERGQNPKRALGIGIQYELDILTWFKKSAWYEAYRKEKSFRLYKKVGEKDRERVDTWTNTNEEDSREFSNYLQFLKPHGLTKADVEINRQNFYDSGNYH